jgi:hypothetical protein
MNPQKQKKVIFFIRFTAILTSCLLIFGCGRKSDISKPTDYKRPSFDNFSDELQN